MKYIQTDKEQFIDNIKIDLIKDSGRDYPWISK